MPRPKRKTSATTLKMTPEIRNYWERCAALEERSLTNMFEVMVRDYAKQLGIYEPSQGAHKPSAASATTKKAKK